MIKKIDDIKIPILQAKVQNIVYKYLTEDNGNDAPMLRKLTGKLKEWVSGFDEEELRENPITLTMDDKELFKIKINRRYTDNKLNIVFSNEFKTLSYLIHTYGKDNLKSHDSSRELEDPDNLKNIFNKKIRLLIINNSEKVKDIIYGEKRFTEGYLSSWNISQNDRLESILDMLDLQGKPILVITDRLSEIKGLSIQDDWWNNLEIIGEEL